MIINEERAPEYSLYYIGGIILDILEKTEGLLIDELYEEIKKKIDSNLHIDFLYYSLDWLYLLSIISLSENKVML